MQLPDLARLSIVKYPAPVLRKRCAPVESFGDDLVRLSERMLGLMVEGKGVGLAAPQVGLSLRLFVCNPGEDPADNLAVVNPEFVELTGAAELEEGCLSIPGVNVKMRRARRAVMRFLDPLGNVHESTAEDLLARIWQHEFDHLEGRLIIDQMSAGDEIANRRAIRQLRDDYAARR
ncbi:MAG: peptide deformylase [Phycisphaerae bacterium]|nr:peptide deformylase [Phycisphaerae bacterium]